MSASFARDDNHTPLHDPSGLRPDFAHVASHTTAGTIDEVSLSSVNVAANQSGQSTCILRVAVVGTNACSFSLGAASSAPSDITTMISLLGNSVSFFKAKSTDVSAYCKQISGASTLEIVAMT